MKNITICFHRKDLRRVFAPDIDRFVLGRSHVLSVDVHHSENGE